MREKRMIKRGDSVDSDSLTLLACEWMIGRFELHARPQPESTRMHA
jgi:hypothetical protein